MLSVQSLNDMLIWDTTRELLRKETGGVGFRDVLKMVYRRRFYSNRGAVPSDESVLDDFWLNVRDKLKTVEVRRGKSCKMYDRVFNILEEFKNSHDLDNVRGEELFCLQEDIERLSMSFDENNIHKNTPELVRILINKKSCTAKDYLKNHLDKEFYNGVISCFGHYTLEAIIIYVLGGMYSSTKDLSMIRLSALIDKLDSFVIVQSDSIKQKESALGKYDRDIDVAIPKYKIGKPLVDFMLEREVISIFTLNDGEIVLRKSGSGYVKSKSYVVCNLELKDLPFVVNIPMIFPPKDWHKVIKEDGRHISDIMGGYISAPTSDIYNRFNIVSSHNMFNFNIMFADDEDLNNFLGTLNGLQRVKFRVNSRVLNYIKNNRERLENANLIEVGFLANVNLCKAFDTIKLAYIQDTTGVREDYTLANLLLYFARKVQMARHDDMIISLASAYEGYVFYLPAFLDFRGRIYRSGILHFHESDIARSLILFDGGYVRNFMKVDIVGGWDEMRVAAAFKYEKFRSAQEALSRFDELKECCENNLINVAVKASNPWQFISKMLGFKSDGFVFSEPLSKDASASAYQIMSYLLLDDVMGKYTNLVPSKGDKIEDIYTNLLEKLKIYVRNKVDEDKYHIILAKLDRSLVKSLFMPLIYGKSVMSMKDDIKLKYDALLDTKESYKLARLFYTFWEESFPDVNNLMRLINLLSWLCSSINRPLLYGMPTFTTIQDYKSKMKESFYVYNHASKKRHKVSLIVPTRERDRRKTKTSTFANFIHQKDAFIAQRVIDYFLGIEAPIYTVHDNFITTLPYAKILPSIYINVFKKLGNPVSIINNFVNINLISPFYPNYFKIDSSNISTNIEALKDNPNLCFNMRVDNPIPLNHLKFMLTALLPDDYTKAKKSTFINNVNKIVVSYDSYVNIVVDAGDPAKKYSKFIKLLKNSPFCVHY